MRVYAQGNIIFFMDNEANIGRFYHKSAIAGRFDEEKLKIGFTNANTGGYLKDSQNNDLSLIPSDIKDKTGEQYGDTFIEVLEAIASLVNFSVGSGGSGITEVELNSAIGGVIGSAPTALNTLGKIASSIGNNASFSQTVATALAGKVSIDTIQEVNATANIASWSSIVVIGRVTAPTNNVVLTLPTSVGSTSKTIRILRYDNAPFTVQVLAQSGEQVALFQAGKELNQRNGAITLQVLADGLIVQTDNIAPLRSDQSIAIPNNISAIGTTVLYTAPTTGMYRVDIYGSVATVGNRNVTSQTISHTEGGTLRTKSVGGGVNTNNQNNDASTSRIIRCDEGTTISYANSLTGSNGAYNLYLTITKI